MKSNSYKTYIPVCVILLGFIAVYGISNFLEKKPARSARKLHR